MVNKVPRSAERFSEPLPLSPYPSAKIAGLPRVAGPRITMQPGPKFRHFLTGGGGGAERGACDIRVARACARARHINDTNICLPSNHFLCCVEIKAHCVSCLVLLFVTEKNRTPNGPPPRLIKVPKKWHYYPLQNHYTDESNIFEFFRGLQLQLSGVFRFS